MGNSHSQRTNIDTPPSPLSTNQSTSTPTLPTYNRIPIAIQVIGTQLDFDLIQYLWLRHDLSPSPSNADPTEKSFTQTMIITPITQSLYSYPLSAIQDDQFLFDHNFSPFDFRKQTITHTKKTSPKRQEKCIYDNSHIYIPEVTVQHDIYDYCAVLYYDLQSRPKDVPEFVNQIPIPPTTQFDPTTQYTLSVSLLPPFLYNNAGIYEPNGQIPRICKNLIHNPTSHLLFPIICINLSSTASIQLAMSYLTTLSQMINYGGLFVPRTTTSCHLTFILQNVQQHLDATGDILDEAQITTICHEMGFIHCYFFNYQTQQENDSLKKDLIEYKESNAKPLLHGQQLFDYSHTELNLKVVQEDEHNKLPHSIRWTYKSKKSLLEFLTNSLLQTFIHEYIALTPIERTRRYFYTQDEIFTNWKKWLLKNESDSIWWSSQSPSDCKNGTILPTVDYLPYQTQRQPMLISNDKVQLMNRHSIYHGIFIPINCPFSSSTQAFDVLYGNLSTKLTNQANPSISKTARLFTYSCTIIPDDITTLPIDIQEQFTMDKLIQYNEDDYEQWIQHHDEEQQVFNNNITNPTYSQIIIRHPDDVKVYNYCSNVKSNRTNYSVIKPPQLTSILTGNSTTATSIPYQYNLINSNQPTHQTPLSKERTIHEVNIRDIIPFSSIQMKPYSQYDNTTQYTILTPLEMEIKLKEYYSKSNIKYIIQQHVKSSTLIPSSLVSELYYNEDYNCFGGYDPHQDLYLQVTTNITTNMANITNTTTTSPTTIETTENNQQQPLDITDNINNQQQQQQQHEQQQQQYRYHYSIQMKDCWSTSEHLYSNLLPYRSLFVSIVIDLRHNTDTIMATIDGANWNIAQLNNCNMPVFVVFITSSPHDDDNNNQSNSYSRQMLSSDQIYYNLSKWQHDYKKISLYQHPNGQYEDDIFQESLRNGNNHNNNNKRGRNDDTSSKYDKKIPIRTIPRNYTRSIETFFPNNIIPDSITTSSHIYQPITSKQFQSCQREKQWEKMYCTEENFAQVWDQMCVKGIAHRMLLLQFMNNEL